MNARKKYISVVLFIAAIDWALWLGGQFFNALMVIPGWSANIPETILLYQQNMLSHIIAYFFLVASPVFLLVPLIIAWILCLKYKTAFSKWFGVSVLLDLIITLIVMIWMAPTARGIFSAAANGTLNVAATLPVLHLWKIANACRVGLGVITLFFFLVSISKLHLLKSNVASEKKLKAKADAVPS